MRLQLRGQLTAPQAARLYDRARRLLSIPGAAELSCDVEGPVDLSVVDALARLQLMARARGARLRVSVAASSEDLPVLLAFLGLSGALADQLEPRGQTEARE